MIKNSDFCIVYYDETNAPTNRKSGTKIAYEYAIKKSEVINIYTITYVMNIIALK